MRSSSTAVSYTHLVYNYSDSEEVYERTPEIYAGDRLLKVQNVRMQKNMVILKLSGIDDRNAAEAAKGTELFITEADLPELPEGQFYIRDLIGMEAVSYTHLDVYKRQEF